MLITDQVAIAPCTDCLQARCPTLEASPVTVWTRKHGELDCSFAFLKESSNDVALPHPKSRKDHHRQKDKPHRRGVVWYLVKRTINITDYGNANDDVNPAKNRAYCGFSHNGW